VTERGARWEQPGYGDITAARIVDGDLEVVFANGDLARLPLSSLGIEASPNVNAPVDVEDGLTIRFGDGDQVVEISWMTIRSAADPAYARHLRDLNINEARRFGRRLRALREDRGITQAQLADAMGLPVTQLARIEKGNQDVRPSTVRTLLSELGASFADVAGPDALEVSVRTIITRAEKAGVPRELSSVLAKAVPRRAAPSFLARAFSWSREALLSGVPKTPQLPVAVQFKAPTGQQPADSPLVHLALSTARLARSAFDVPPYRPIPGDPAVIRREAIDAEGRITLASLLDWTWSKGVAVLPLAGKGGFTAAVLEVDEAPTIVIKETRDFAVFWLFDLAHELGHVGRGHVQKALIDVESPTNPTMSDADERSATAFALELLLPDPLKLLEEVRVDARGDGVRFKFAVERAAARAQVSPGLLGIIAAFALQEVGRPKDRWGSATNLAKPEGSGREVVRIAARRRAVLERLPALDASLIRTAVLGDSG
jgi:transcriptional regulator with XRE-family HTH domain